MKGEVEGGGKGDGGERWISVVESVVVVVVSLFPSQSCNDSVSLFFFFFFFFYNFVSSVFYS